MKDSREGKNIPYNRKLDWEMEKLKVEIANSPSYLCRFRGAKLWGDCKSCDGKREGRLDCTAFWPDFNVPVIKVFNIEFCNWEQLRYLKTGTPIKSRR